MTEHELRRYFLLLVDQGYAERDGDRFRLLPKGATLTEEQQREIFEQANVCTH